MLSDVVCQRLYLETCLADALTNVGDAYIEPGLADAELEEERAEMQAFLNTVTHVAGGAFVQRMLGDVEHSVEVMSVPPGNDVDKLSSYSSGSASSPPTTCVPLFVASAPLALPPPTQFHHNPKA